jgi:hypothetical protein
MYICKEIQQRILLIDNASYLVIEPYNKQGEQKSGVGPQFLEKVAQTVSNLPEHLHQNSFKFLKYRQQVVFSNYILW